jgi:ATPase subunit of ABC transporter with duplicated ATPase domains
LGRRATVAKNNVSVKGKMKTGAFGQNPLKKSTVLSCPKGQMKQNKEESG